MPDDPGAVLGNRKPPFPAGVGRGGFFFFSTEKRWGGLSAGRLARRQAPPAASGRARCPAGKDTKKSPGACLGWANHQASCILRYGWLVPSEMSSRLSACPSAAICCVQRRATTKTPHPPRAKRVNPPCSNTRQALPPVIQPGRSGRVSPAAGLKSKVPSPCPFP